MLRLQQIKDGKAQMQKVLADPKPTDAQKRQAKLVIRAADEALRRRRILARFPEASKILPPGEIAELLAH